MLTLCRLSAGQTRQIVEMVRVLLVFFWITLVKCQSNSSSSSSSIPAYHLERCMAPQQTDYCGGYAKKFFYDKKLGECRVFWDGKCPNVKNRFDKKTQCLRVCNPEKLQKLRAEEAARRHATNNRHRTAHRQQVDHRDSRREQYENRTGSRHNTHDAVTTGNNRRPQPLAYTESCHLSVERGTCSNYTIRWYFDSSRGRCDRFWYGGCGGNGNRFMDQDQCEGRCLEKTPKPTGCTVSVYGCCSDGVTSARGPRRRGCPERRLIGGCAGTRHGCCEDGVTSARGPQKAGCPETLVGGCAGTRHGCCKDGVTSARGPHKVGCPETLLGGCGGTQHGCCEDGVTAARGPHKVGCPETFVGGCAGTQHGCCEDGTTSASGPEKQGCPETRNLLGGCAGTRYGCCNDGVSSARGENNLGCAENPNGGCSVSHYGCCADGVTFARGVDKKGCPEEEPLACEASTYGCCPDGVTIATDPDQSMCAPFDTASCGLPRDNGERCASSGYLKRWFYDTKYGACREFYFYGCKGNANRYESEDECLRSCINVEGRDICLLPEVKGPCRSRQPRFYFDSESGTCKPFVYGGCNGNNNNFKTVGECDALCTGANMTVATGCVHKGVNYLEGDKFKDDCNTCKCMNGNVACTKKACVEGCTHKGETYSDGESFKDDCNTCRCQRGNVACTRKACRPSGCTHKGVTYTDGESFKDDCNTCRCQRGNVACTRMACRPSVCTHKGEKYRDGESFKDDCNTCACRNGNVACTLMACPPVERPCDRRPCQNGFSCQGYNNGTYACSCHPDWGTDCVAPPAYWCFYDAECAGDMKCVHERDCSDSYCHVVSKCSAGTKELTCDNKDLCSSRAQDCVNDDSLDEGYFCSPKIRYRRPHRLVLGCDLSKFGCCQDDTTAAEGPDYEGCDMVEGSGDVACEDSIYGCCPDGVNAATGIRGQGCGDVTDADRTVGAIEPIVPKQEKCTAEENREKCTEFTVKWRFEKSEENCRQHWWGGCADNGNVFDSKEECEVSCLKNVVISEGGDEDGDFVNMCDMERDPGPCNATISRYFYDPRERSCRVFEFGGCGGNENNFVTLESCQLECMGGVLPAATTTTPAPTPPETIQPPLGNFELSIAGKRHYNEGEDIRVTCQIQGGQPSRDSLTFYINGEMVKSNTDRIRMNEYTSAADGGFIMGTDLVVLQATPSDSGTYTCYDKMGESESMTVHVKEAPVPQTTPTTTVAPVFETESKIVINGSSVVLEGAEIRIVCRASGPRRPSGVDWFINGRYANDTSRIYTFNDPRALNAIISEYTINSATRKDAAAYYCRSLPYGDHKKLRINVEKSKEEVVTIPDAGVTESSDPQVVCLMRKQVGNCRASFTRWHYSHLDGGCKQFDYSGCQGNSNNFQTEEHCNKFCSASDVCHQPKVIGRCRAAKRRVYFDSVTGTCKNFIYGGCGSNLNNFKDFESCERKCERFVEGSVEVDSGDDEDEEEDACSLQAHKGTCHGYSILWYYNSALNLCKQFVYTGCGGNSNRFNNRPECESQCKRSTNVRPRPTSRPRQTPRPTFRPTTESNIIPTRTGDRCSQDKDQGRYVKGWNLFWYFDTQRQICRRFYYGGAGGNENRFNSQEECENACEKKTPAPYTTPRPRPTRPTRPTRRPAHSSCYYSRWGCCSDGVTTALDSRRSNCYDDNNINRPGSSDTKMMVKVGSDTFLHCTIGNHNVLWYRDGFLLNSTRRFEVMTNGTLVLKAITSDMAGSYSCRVTIGPNYDPHLQRFKVEVYHPMTILNGPALMSVRPRENAFLHCQVNGNPQPRIYWEKDGVVLINSHELRVFGNGTLIIISMEPRDIGTYKCVAENGISEPVSRDIEVNIRESIEAKIQKHKGSFLQGEYIRLRCQGSGFPPPTVEWYKEGQILTTSGRVRVSSGELLISGANVQDSGVYKCVVSNGQATAQDLTSVRIKFPDQAPGGQCRDLMSVTRCRLIITGRLCSWHQFSSRCCASCSRANRRWGGKR